MRSETKTLAKVSPGHLERFLVELLNLNQDIEAIGRFMKRFANFVPLINKEMVAYAGRLRPHGLKVVLNRARMPVVRRFPRKGGVPANHELLIELTETEIATIERVERLVPNCTYFEIEARVILLKELLRYVWGEQNLRQREWSTFVIRGYLYSIDMTPSEPSSSAATFWSLQELRLPPPTPFERALVYLVNSGDKARLCPNPDCPAPYFFVKRKNQRYCSEICAAPAQRELKRKWWAEHGEEWRAARQGTPVMKTKSSRGTSAKATKSRIKKVRKVR